MNLCAKSGHSSFPMNVLIKISQFFYDKISDKSFRLDRIVCDWKIDNGRRSHEKNNSSLVPHEEVLGLNPGQGKQLQLFQGRF